MCVVQKSLSFQTQLNSMYYFELHVPADLRSFWVSQLVLYWGI